MKTAFLWMIPLSLIGVETGAASTATKPNIIIINCDDMGYGDLSCFVVLLRKHRIWIGWHWKVRNGVAFMCRLLYPRPVERDY
ncbi:arylsulfatase A [Parabacteroides sp. CAG:409]|nr:arylsulfatase A [Parabacteroides sp. CAG:409]